MATTRPPHPAEPERQSKEVAFSFVDRLGREDRQEYFWSAGQQRTNSLIGDVESTVEELDASLLWARRARVPVPCIVEEEQQTVPIIATPTNPRRYPFPPFPLFSPFYYRDSFEESIKEVSALGKFTWSDPREVPKMILSPLTKFLTVRFRWIAENPEFRSLGAAASPQANNPYILFTIHTRTSGLRIQYSKTFALNFNSVLGAPTTPVKGWILPGIHKFAGMNSTGRMRYDKGTFTTPPDFSADLIL